MILAECIVVAALVLVAWRVMAGAPASNGAALPVVPPAASATDSAMPPSPSVPAPPSPVERRLPPGLNLDVGFWRIRLGTINSEESSFEALEWRLVHSAMNSARQYLDSVVIPEVVRAEGGAG